MAYNERILASTASAQRRHRGERVLVNVRLELARLEAEEADRLRRFEAARPPAGSLERQVRQRDAEEYELVWDGSSRRPLTGGHGLIGSSLAPGPGFATVAAGD